MFYKESEPQYENRGIQKNASVNKCPTDAFLKIEIIKNCVLLVPLFLLVLCGFLWFC